MKRLEKLLAILLAIIMVVGVMPLSVFAETSDSSNTLGASDSLEVAEGKKTSPKAYEGAWLRDTLSAHFSSSIAYDSNESLQNDESSRSIPSLSEVRD